MAWSRTGSRRGRVILFIPAPCARKRRRSVYGPRARETPKQRESAATHRRGGCVASQEGAAIVARAPYVDLVFGRRRCTVCRR